MALEAGVVYDEAPSPDEVIKQYEAEEHTQQGYKSKLYVSGSVILKVTKKEERFMKEIQNQSKVYQFRETLSNGAHVPKIHKVIECHEQIVTVMQMIPDGVNLEITLHDKSIPFDTRKRRAEKAFNEVCILLDSNKGYLHNDTLPPNVVVDKDENIWLVDFETATFDNTGPNTGDKLKLAFGLLRDLLWGECRDETTAFNTKKGNIQNRQWVAFNDTAPTVTAGLTPPDVKRFRSIYDDCSIARTFNQFLKYVQYDSKHPKHQSDFFWLHFGHQRERFLEPIYKKVPLGFMCADAGFPDRGGQIHRVTPHSIITGRHAEHKPFYFTFKKPPAVEHYIFTERPEPLW